MPYTKSVMNGTTKISANRELSIVPASMAPSLVRNPPISSGPVNDLLNPYRDDKPSRLNSAPLPQQQPTTPFLRSKPVDTPCRHPKHFSNFDSVPSIPRKYSTAIGSSDANSTTPSHTLAQKPSYLRYTVNDQIPSKLPQSAATNPAKFDSRTPNSPVNIEDDAGRPPTSRNTRPPKQVSRVAEEKKSFKPVKPGPHQNGAQKRPRFPPVLDLDSEDAVGEKVEVIDCEGGGKVKTRSESVMETAASGKRVRSEGPSAFEKVQDEAWMNRCSDKDQYLSALRTALSEHPNIINLSHLALSSADLRVILEEPIPTNYEELSRAYEIDNNRITGLTQYMWKSLAANSTDRLNLAHNGLTTIEGHISLCVRLRFLNLSRNELKSLPKEICQLESLETINVSHNFLQQLPQKMRNLRKLEILNVANNDLEGLPTDLVDDGSKLFAIDISFNIGIKVLPECLKHCKELANLELSRTGLRELLRVKDLSTNVFSLANIVAGRSEEDLLYRYRSKEGKFPPAVVAPPSEKSGRAAIERYESRKSALRAKETNEVMEVHTVDDS